MGELHARIAKEPIPRRDERRAREAFGVAVGGVVRGVEFAGIDCGAGFAPADHGVPHGHPAGVAGDALALEAVEDDRRVEVQRCGAGRCNTDAFG